MLVLDYFLDVLDSVGWVYLQDEWLAIQLLHENLHDEGAKRVQKKKLGKME